MPETPDYLTPAQASHVAPGNPGPATVWRWMVKGVKAPNGQTICLRHLRMGGKLLTTLDWIIEFGESLAAARTPEDAPAETLPASRAASCGTRDRQIREAQENLLNS